MKSQPHSLLGHPCSRPFTPPLFLPHEHSSWAHLKGLQASTLEWDTEFYPIPCLFTQSSTAWQVVKVYLGHALH